MPLEQTMWVEKYRPKKLEEIANQVSVKERLAPLLGKKAELPHLLFAGPPGSGKTTTALIIAKEILGELSSDYTLSLNASDERGIEMVRERVKNFARYADRREGIPFRLIILDEADSMTADAQTALRRIMEESSRLTRFILICVAPWTRVVLPEEIETTISCLRGKANVSVTSFDLRRGRPEDDHVVNVIQTEPKTLGKRCLRISTNTGRELELTEDHPIWADSGWKAAGDIKEGDLIAVFPHLESTTRELDSRIILSEKSFADQVDVYERARMGRKGLGEATEFCWLTTKAKREFAYDARKIYGEFVQSNNGITPREGDAIRMIEGCPGITRETIERTLGLSRLRTNELLRTLERRGHIVRIASRTHAQVHRFQRTSSEIAFVRNLADVRRILQQRYSFKVSYSALRRVIKESRLSGRAERAARILRQLGLLPLTYDSENVGALARLTGFLFGDGTLASSGRRLIFTGNTQTLLEVRKDLRKLGIRDGKIRKKFIIGEISGRKVEGTTTFFYVDSAPLWSVFQALGVPSGDKADASYEVPQWIRSGTRFVKREFLRAFFGCESCAPKFRRSNPEAMWLTQNKTARHLESGKLFMNQVAKLVAEFDVSTVPLRVTRVGIRRDGQHTYQIKLELRASNYNMRNFFGRIGFCYEAQKRAVSRLAYEYLRYKSHLLAGREMLALRVMAELTTGGKTLTEVSYDIGCTPDFVENVRAGKGIGLSRKGLLDFQAWTRKHAIVGTELVWNAVEKVEGINLSSVLDIATENYHNFISNGIISHNCNYSSGIIEPIQSRCALFRFQRLDETSVITHLKEIARKEKVKLSDERVLSTIFESTNGDLRQAINLLQAASASGEVTLEKVRAVTGSNVKGRVDEIIRLALDGEFEEARLKMVELTRVYGIPERDFLRLANEVLNSLKVDTAGTAIGILAEYDYRLVMGAQPELQLTAMLAALSALKKRKGD